MLFSSLNPSSTKLTLETSMWPRNTALNRLCRVVTLILGQVLMVSSFSASGSSSSNINTSPVAKPSTSSAGNNLEQLKAILWDMDGVLADTERDAHRPAFNRVFQEEGLDTEWSVEQYGKLLEVGGGKERMTAHWNEVGWPKTMRALTDEEKQGKVMELHLRKTDVFMGLINEGDVPLRPGVLRVIDSAIEAGLTLAVCSTSNELAVRNLVSTLLGPERGAKFSIFAGDMVAKKKPAPDIYLMAVDTLGLDKSTCVIIEDSAIGLRAAKAAGIACVVTKSSYTVNEDFTCADMVLDELGDDPETGVSLETLDELIIASRMSKS